jgi:hypothetical protein
MHRGDGRAVGGSGGSETDHVGVIAMGMNDGIGQGSEQLRYPVKLGPIAPRGKSELDQLDAGCRKRGKRQAGFPFLQKRHNPRLVAAAAMSLGQRRHHRFEASDGRRRGHMGDREGGSRGGAGHG